MDRLIFSTIGAALGVAAFFLLYYIGNQTVDLLCREIVRC